MPTEAIFGPEVGRGAGMDQFLPRDPPRLQSAPVPPEGRRRAASAV